MADADRDGMSVRAQAASPANKSLLMKRLLLEFGSL